MLRNRRVKFTGDVYENVVNSYSKESFFQAPTPREKLAKQIKTLPLELRSLAQEMVDNVLADETKKERKRIKEAEMLIDQVSGNKNTLLRMMKDEKLMEEFSKQDHVKGFDVSGMSGVVKYVLGSAMATAAAATDIKIVGGVPAGKSALCGALQLFCDDGYVLADGNLLTQFMRVFNPANSKAGLTTPVLMQGCLSTEVVGNKTAEFILDNVANGTATCISNSNLFQDYTATVQATQMSQSACANFNQMLQPVYQQCMNQASSTTLMIGIIAGSVVGGIALLTIAFCAWRMCKAHKESSIEMGSFRRN